MREGTDCGGAYQQSEDRRAYRAYVRPQRAHAGDPHVKDKFGVTDPSERLARVEEGLRHATAKLDLRNSRRFEIIKIIIGTFVVAIIGGAVSAGYQWLPKVFEATRTHRGSPTEKP